MMRGYAIDIPKQTVVDKKILLDMQTNQRFGKAAVMLRAQFDGTLVNCRFMLLVNRGGTLGDAHWVNIQLTNGTDNIIIFDPTMTTDLTKFEGTHINKIVPLALPSQFKLAVVNANWNSNNITVTGRVHLYS